MAALDQRGRHNDAEKAGISQQASIVLRDRRRSRRCFERLQPEAGDRAEQPERDDEPDEPLRRDDIRQASAQQRADDEGG